MSISQIFFVTNYGMWNKETRFYFTLYFFSKVLETQILYFKDTSLHFHWLFSCAKYTGVHLQSQESWEGNFLLPPLQVSKIITVSQL